MPSAFSNGAHHVGYYIPYRFANVLREKLQGMINQPSNHIDPRSNARSQNNYMGVLQVKYPERITGLGANHTTRKTSGLGHVIAWNPQS